MASEQIVTAIRLKVDASKAITIVVVGAEVVAAEEVEATATIDIHAELKSMRQLYFLHGPANHIYVESDHTKQADLSWGAPTGESEFQDEKAGEAIAKEEEKDEGAAGGWDSGVAALPDDAPAGADGIAPPAAPADAPAGPAEEPEPEDNSRSYADYLAEQAEKKLKLGSGVLEARKPNEGSKQKKEWDNAKPVSKDEEDEYMAGKASKARREKQRKEKERVDVDLRYVEPNAGGRGGGERGRGRGRGDRGDFRGRGRGRGDNFRGRGDGGYRGGRGRGDSGYTPNVGDENAFPTLGGS